SSPSDHRTPSRRRRSRSLLPAPRPGPATRSARASLPLLSPSYRRRSDPAKGRTVRRSSRPAGRSGSGTLDAVHRVALAVVVLLLAVTPSALGVVGGHAVDVRDAPWSVLVIHRAGASTGLCSGVIIDATHVVTAAHCAVEDGVPAPASALTIRA